MYPLTIIIDGSYLFHKTLGVSKGYTKKYNETNKYLNNSKDLGIFIRKVATDLVYSLNVFNGYKRVIFTKDTKSWRKKFDIPIPGHSGYKGTRKGKNDVNMDIFHKSMDDFGNILSNYGVLVSRIESAEGDDLMHLWANYLMNKKDPENVIIITGDGDISQLLDYNDNVYTAIYSNRTAQNTNMFIKPGFRKWLQERVDAPGNIFNLQSLNKIMSVDGIDIIKKAMTIIPSEEINPFDVVFNKIICGDDGDNVPSTWEWVNEKGTHLRITNKHYKKLYQFIKDKKKEYLNIDSIIYDDKVKNLIRLKLQDITNTQLPKDEYINRLNLNIKLVCLEYDLFPGEIVTEFNKTKEQLILENHISSNLTKVDLLSNTKYDNAGIKLESDLFELM